MPFTNFFRSLLKQYAVTTGDGCTCQVGILVVTTAQQAEEFSLLLLFVAGRRGCSRVPKSRSFLECALNARVQLSDCPLETIDGSGIEFLGLVVLGSQIADFRVYRRDFLFQALQPHHRIVSVGLLILVSRALVLHNSNSGDEGTAH